MIKKLKYLRAKTIKRIPNLSNEELSTPISYWIKKDRLLNGRGKEFTIILRTKGCKWALGESGGCSMCGYIKDSYAKEVDPSQVKRQFLKAWNDKKELIQKDSDKYILKIFNSGSFFDNDEISEDLRSFIYKQIVPIHNISEIVVESRVEFIDEKKLRVMKSQLKNKHIEIAIGLESANDHIRNTYINKGLLYSDFMKAVELIRKCEIGVRVYLLFKPPFLNEKSAIDDCVDSIKRLLELKVDTISINPMNIQTGTLVEYLWKKGYYRAPWLYSLIKCLKLAISSQDVLEKTRIVSDPSGLGTKRGIHNCNDAECNGKMARMLQDFVLSQDFDKFLISQGTDECRCKLKYHIQKVIN